MRAFAVVLGFGLLAAQGDVPSQPPHAGKMVSISVHDAQLAEALSALFREAQLSYAIVPGGEELEGPASITVKLKNVPFDKALEVILQPYRLRCRIVGPVYVIEGMPEPALPVTDWARDGLVGPVCTVLTKTERLSGELDETDDAGASTQSHTVRYDAQGRITEQAHTNPDGGLSHEITYEYGIDQRLAEKAAYTAGGSLDSQWVYTYDSKGNCTREAYYDGSGRLVSKKSLTYEYDSRGNWVKRTMSRWVVKRSGSHYEATEAVSREIYYHDELRWLPPPPPREWPPGLGGRDETSNGSPPANHGGG